MKKSDIWFLILVVFILLDVVLSWNIWINICVILCSIVVLTDSIIRLIGVIKNAGNKA